MTIHTHPSALSVLSLSVLLAMSTQAVANDGEQTQTQSATPTVVLESDEIIISRTAPVQVGQAVVNRDTLDVQNIQDAKDLVRYNTEVDVAEVGRYGNKGFAIRGVDGNRVAMNIDGVPLPDVESNEIFSPYGYMYEGRFSPDLEMMDSVRITAGADSLTSGSGAVGGSVAYLTKEPSDILQGDDTAGGYAKIGYNSKNSEKLIAAGLAFDHGRAQGLLNYSYRQGSETKNHAMRRADDIRINPEYLFSEEEMPSAYDTASLIYPNPMAFDRESALAKLYFSPTDEHRFGVHGMYQRTENDINVESTNSTGSRTGNTTRRAHDIEELKSYGANYRYQPDNSSALDTLSVDYTHSDVLGLADTWVYRREFTCSDPSISSWMCEYRGKEMVLNKDNVTLSNREYRPTQTVTDQVSLSLKSVPFDLGKFGEHKLSLDAKYAKHDYTSSATYLSNSSYIKDHLSYAFPDADKTNYSITLTDSVRLNDRLRALAGLRYDNFNYSPYFQDDVNGLSETTRNNDVCNNSSNTTIYCQLYRSGNGLAQSKFHHLTWNAGFDYEVIADKLDARYKIGTGFLAPTVSQIYSNFEGMGIRQVPNYALKPEKSLNQELELKWTVNDDVSLSASGYLTQYDDFIHTRFWQGDTNGCDSRSTCLQSTNLDTAKIYGVRLGAKADLSNWLNTKGRLSVSADYHTARDSAKVTLDDGSVATINTLASVPATLIVGADYISPNEDWSLHARVRGIAAKKAKDTKSVEVAPIESVTTTTCPSDIAAYGYCDYYGYRYDSATGSYTKTATAVTGYDEYVDTYKYADKSKDAMVVDIYGTKKFGQNKQFIINAGVYNLTNTKYIPWETLRMFNTTNTNQMVGADGYGFARYTAPGRNFGISATYQF